MDRPSEWDESGVARWLEENGFSHLTETLVRTHKIDGRGLLSLTKRDVIEFAQIRVLGDVKRLLFAIRDLRKASEDKRIDRVSAESSNDEDDEGDDVPSSENGGIGRISADGGDFCSRCYSSGLSRVNPAVVPERWKTLIAFAYVLVVSWMTAFVMVIVHDRVPDMNKYPPLPDILLDNIPHIPWAFEMCEVTGMVLLAVWCVILVFHKHRFVLMRRFFSISGTIFLLRCVTMLITSLSVPGKHLDCAPRPYGDIWNKYYNAYQIWSGAGLTTQGVRTCGDYMFSGHTVGLTLLNFFITEYTSTKVYFLHTFTWICNVFGIFFILAAHEHYSIDVFVAFYITSRLFMYYHTLANNRSNQPRREVGRTWFWFPLFSYFENGVHGKIPNEFEWPITFSDIDESLKKIIFTIKIKYESRRKNLYPTTDKVIDENANKPEKSKTYFGKENQFRKTAFKKKRKQP